MKTHIRRTIRAALHANRPLRYWALSGAIAAHLAAGHLIRTTDFLTRIGLAHQLPDGQHSWYGRHVAKAHRATTGHEPLRCWVQHRTTGRWIHVYVYGPIDQALYTALHTYKATRQLIAASYTRCA